ncbi:urea ABC transporter permease subunit UrtB, partial [Vibrio sp. M260118]
MAAVTDEMSFEKALVGKKTAEKQAAITWLITNKTSNLSQPILDGWLNGNLYYFSDRKSDFYKQIFLVSDIKTDTQATSIWGQQTLAIENVKQFKKVRVNNKLRGLIRTQIAYLGLQDSDTAVRYDAAYNLMGTKDKAIIEALSQQAKSETDTKVAEQIDLVLALYRSQDTSLKVDERMSAIEFISDYKQSDVLKALNSILGSETNQQILTAANQALAKYQQSQRLYSGVETVFFGLSLGSVLVLAGIGLAITFGVMGVINMAHGELIMIGAYTTYVLQLLMPNNIGLALILSVPAAFVVSGLVGVAIERTVIRHLYGRPLETLLATFGISLILQQAVRSIFSPLNRSVSTPEFMSG